MKIYLKLFKDINLGNCIIELILITTNKIKVSDLKQIIFHKYGIEQSLQKLTMKLNNEKFITMADEFPLSFFKVKENTMINVEIIENIKIKEDIVQKVKKRENKSKYLKHLNIFKKRRHLDIIEESTIEDMDDLEIKFYSLNNINPIPKIDDMASENMHNYFNNQIEERFYNSIINNKLNEFRDILKHYKEFIDINKPIDKLKKYSAVHFASKYEYCEMMNELINKYNADVNMISLDGWSPLHISAYKGNINIINILIKCKKTDFNLSLPKIGTALHCACKNNHFKIVALLLNKCNPNIKDDEGLFPIDITIDINIKKLISKSLNIFSDFEENVNEISINRKIKSDGGIGEHITKSQLLKFKFLRNLAFIPPHPSRYIGYIYKKGKILSYYNLRYIEINAVKGFFIRFLSKDDYPSKPKEVLSLKKIANCKKKKTSEQGKYYIEIVFGEDTHIYRLDSLKAFNIWIEEINKSIMYTKFWANFEQKYPDVTAFLCSLKQDVYEIDYLSGEIRKIELNQNIKESTEISNNINMKSTNVESEEKIKILESPLLNSSSIGIDSFTILDNICKGNFGNIYKVKFKLNGEIYSMKALNKKYLIKNNILDNVISHYNMVKEIVSPFIINLCFSFQTADDLYFIFDFFSGGDLNFHLKHTLFEEEEAKFYIAEIILAIEYLHKIDMVYKHFNSKNVLIENDNHIKLSDFELIREGIYESNNSNITYDKSRQGIGKSADMYGIGAILYEMISGSPPFYYTNIKTNIKNKESELIFYDYFSDELKDLLSKLLSKDSNRRIGLYNKVEIKNHPWFKDIDWDKMSRKAINPPLNLVLMKKEIDDNKNYINNENNKSISNKNIIQSSTQKKHFSFIREDNII